MCRYRYRYVPLHLFLIWVDMVEKHARFLRDVWPPINTNKSWRFVNRPTDSDRFHIYFWNRFILNRFMNRYLWIPLSTKMNDRVLQSWLSDEWLIAIKCEWIHLGTSTYIHFNFNFWWNWFWTPFRVWFINDRLKLIWFHFKWIELDLNWMCIYRYVSIHFHLICDDIHLN